MFKKGILTYLLVMFAFFCEAAVINGPFRGTSLAFFFVHKGGPLKLSLRCESYGLPHGVPSYVGKDALVLGRIFDAEEHLVAWDYFRVKHGSEKVLSHDFGEAPAGVYQIRYSGHNVKAWVAAEPEASFGVMPMRCCLKYGCKEQFDNTYFYIPENAKKLGMYLYNCKLTITDEAGKKYELKTGNSPLDIEGKQGQVWKLNGKLPVGDYNYFGSNGMPLILCPDKETALAIHGSVEKAKDGTFYPHKFQVRMHDWIQAHKDDDLSMQHIDIKSKLPLMKKEPNSVGLLGPWGLFNHINSMIEQQKMDKDSPDFGASPYLESMAAALGLDREYNPFFRHPVLEKRVMIGIFQDLMKMKENDTWEESPDQYCGGDVLGFVHKLKAFYHGITGVTDEECRALWSEAIRREADRFSMFRVSCDNQSSHWPYIYQCLYERLGEEKYAEMAKDYIWGMSREGGDRHMKTGYQQEAYGPDGTYQGLGTCYQAVYYRMTGNPVAKNTLRIIYDFYNHSLAPQPDGKVFGCSNYGHRTTGSWVYRQYGGGLNFLKHEVPEATVWFRNYVPANIDNAIAQFREIKCNPGNGAKYATAVISPFYTEFLFPNEPFPGAKFPVEASNDFTKNFNNEFIAVRRPKYYTFTYIGHTAPAWLGQSRPKKEENKSESGKWACTQGLGLLWFQDYGSVLTAMNWNGNTGCFLRADLNNGECAYPDYWSTKEAFDGKAITLEQKLFNQDCVAFKRSLSFMEDGIRQELEISISKENNIKDLYEQLPLLDYNGLKLEYMVNGKWQDKPGKASKVRLNQAVVISLDRALPVSLGPATINFNQKIQPLRLHLGNDFKPGDTIKLSYTITK